MKNVNTLQSKIMRRVYYAFGIRLATHPITTHMVVLALAVVAFARLVHVAAVYRNVTNVRVNEVGTYIMKAIVHADTATLVVLGLIIFTLLSLRLRLTLPNVRMQQAV